MSPISDPVTITVSKALLAELEHISEPLVDRMHELLERNTDGLLTEGEKAELERTVQLVEIGQIFSMALHPKSAP